MNADSRRGFLCAERHLLPRTAGVIRQGMCYVAIFQMAVEEAGSVDDVIDILTEEGNVEWAREFTYAVSGLTEGQREQLRTIAI